MRRVSTSRVLHAAACLPAPSAAIWCQSCAVRCQCGVVVKSLSPASNVIYVCREQSGGDHVESHTLKE